MDISLGRLREAREARGLSLDELAARVGTSRQLISRYELEKVVPRPETFLRLCAALNVTPEFFTLPAPASELAPMFFRHFTSRTPRKQLASVKRQILWVRDLISVAEESVVLPPVDLPDFHPPSDPRLISDEKIEESATALRRYWGLGDGIILEAVKLIENKGCVVVCGVIDSLTIDAFSQWTKIGRPFLVFDCRKGGAARSRFSVIHELGHLILHRHCDKRFVELNPDTHKRIEQQADRFASAFLMPEATFKKSLPYVSLDNMLLIKQQWNLSVAAMLHRAADLKMVSKEIERNLWINLVRRGWKKTEPLDDLIAPEEPRLLRNALVAVSEITKGNILALARRVGLQVQDLERYAGLEPGELLSDEFAYIPQELQRKRA
jgi:Zn-dependent peptidase ImmA (M78 family)/transcriptional regulator with XRE-family HTH domain